MRLNEQETSVLAAFRRLPADTAGEVAALIERLAAAAGNTRIDWSEEWSEQDLRDFTRHSAARVEAEEF